MGYYNDDRGYGRGGYGGRDNYRGGGYDRRGGGYDRRDRAPLTASAIPILASISARRSFTRPLVWS